MPRVELTLKERVEICRHHAVTSSITNKALSVWTTEKMKKPISEMTISRILKRTSELLASQGSTHVKRYRKPECPNLERILFAWFLTMQEANVTMSDEMLIAKARMLHNTVPRETEKEIKFSNGWLQGFKRRNGISAYVRHGKALLLRSIVGKKKSKARLSIALTANMTGHKMVSIREQIHIIRVEFLPPNVTAIYQPMDAGIIRAFKAHYQKRLIHFKLECLQAGQSSDIDVYTALLMIENAWRVDVSSKTVRKCWVHSKLVTFEGILPDFNTLEEVADLSAGIHSDGTRELREALRQLEEITLDSGIVPNMTFSEYIDFENVQEAFDQISVEELAELQGMPEVDIAEEADDHENLESDPIISMQEWNAATEIMRKFLEQSDRDLLKVGSKMKKLLEEIRFLVTAALVQSEITSFFSVESNQ
ncbi:hypothetical protein R1sor_011534 [Riccia sorocarpa]|uniref:HTH CENPB-type domain-containing protein n=1 Tax=Riccia sorocarpa TaxID=122646 RepID=A0ABD3I195_9MARC